MFVEVRSDEDDIDNIKNPLEKVTAGLLDSSGQQIPLQMVHVKCKLMDLLSQVNQTQVLLPQCLVKTNVFHTHIPCHCFVLFSKLGHHLSEIYQSELCAHRGQVCVSSGRFCSSVWL